MALDKYDSQEAEARLQKIWIKEGTYKFDPESNKPVFSVDTPPPTVSGKMHMGHAFSYSQQDFVVRFQRMRGKNIFYPFGTDDNGLATERLIEKTKNVKASRMDRQEFVKLCLETLDKEFRPQYIADWKRIGMSCDWSIFYTTIDEHCQRISQRSFIELYNANRIYRKKSPMMICPQCQTAIAQVEMQDEEKKSTLNYIKAKLETGEYLVYATTRPELLPGCIGMTLNKDGIYVKTEKDKEIWILSKEGFEKFKDQWNLKLKKEVKGQEFVGKIVTIPLSNAKIEVRHDPESKTEYGSGIVYWCSYGGMECVEFMVRHPDLKPIHIMDISGKYNELAGNYNGMNSEEARKQVLEDLEKDGSLILKQHMKHAVNVHERCGTDIEYVATEQWFIKYLDMRDKFLEAGEELNWFPTHMKNRLDNWIKGLKWDWCISRQRFFGVPFPVWYCKKCGGVILAKEENLPVDPLKDKPSSECNCSSKEFVPEKDILDTWATSSLTPQLATELFKDKPIFEKLFPMSLRPQAHDIITFWLFNTMVKSQLHYKVNPWENTMISGWALDPHGRKMSKSKGNVVEPQKIIEKYSADAMRFWAAGSKLGDDMPYQEKDIITGQKMIRKLWNAAKFSLEHLKDYKLEKQGKLNSIDKFMLSKLNKVVCASTEAFEKYEFSKTKLGTENFFWNLFCDYYLEIIKSKLYNKDKYTEEEIKSTKYTLYTCLLTCLKLFAPIMPHVTDEIYRAFFAEKEKQKSIHASSWPEFDSSLVDENLEKKGELLLEVIAAVRQYKSKNNLALNKEITKLVIGKEKEKELNEFAEDLKNTTNSKEVVFGEAKDLEVNDKLKLDIQL